MVVIMCVNFSFHAQLEDSNQTDNKFCSSHMLRTQSSETNPTHEEQNLKIN